VECPRCGNDKEFEERDSGPDSFDDDISYTSYICKKCGLFNDGWVDKWFKDTECWSEVDDDNEFIKGVSDDRRN